MIKRFIKPNATDQMVLVKQTELTEILARLVTLEITVAVYKSLTNTTDQEVDNV